MAREVKGADIRGKVGPFFFSLYTDEGARQRLFMKVARSRYIVSWCAFCTLAFIAFSGCSKRDENAVSPSDVLPAGAENSLLAIGSEAPDFEALSHTGQAVRLSSLRGKAVVLYFYPKDGTPGCTTQAKGFRDHYQDIEQAGALVIGVSTQDNESHQAFAQRYGLPFFLIPDEDGEIAEAYGVGSVLGFNKRVTFVIDQSGKIAKIYEKVSPPGHAQEILNALHSLPPYEAKNDEEVREAKDEDEDEDE